MQLLKKMAAFKKKSTPRTIDDVEFQFYPVRVALVVTGQMREMLEPVSDAIQVLLHPRSLDQEVLEEQTPDGSIARCRKPVLPEVARMRSESKSKAISAALAKLFSDDTRYMVGRLIMDSLRDDCPASPSDQDVRSFVDAPEMDVARFGEFVRGFLAANAAIFGDLGNVIRERMEAVMTKMMQPEVPESGDSVASEEQPEASQRAVGPEGEVPTT